MLTILHRDAHLVAIDKPPGLLVHRSDVDRQETRFAVQLLRDQIGCHVTPVHRLDRGTSGVLLFALDDGAARGLAAQFERHAVAKRYLAIVRGWPAVIGRIDHPLARIRDDRAHDGAAAGPRPARTAFRRLATVELAAAVDRYATARYALLALAARTGRRHQLRRHLKHIAHPIIGDATYGKGRHNRFFDERFGVRRLLLACVSLRCRHPVTGSLLTIEAPPGGDFSRVCAALGWAGALEPGRDGGTGVATAPADRYA